MPSSFDSFNNGDVIDAHNVSEMHGPIQNLERGKSFYGEASGGTTAYAVTLDPEPDNPYQSGMLVNFKVNVENTAGSPDVTLNVNSVGAKPIVKSGGVSLAAGDLEADRIVSVIYDEVEERFNLISASPNSADDMPAERNNLRAHLNSSQSIGATSVATLNYQTAITNDCFTYSSGVFTCTKAGWYMITANFKVSGISANGLCGIKKNSSPSTIGTAPGPLIPLTNSPTVVAPVYLAVNDTFEIVAYNGHSSSVTLDSYDNSGNGCVVAVRM